MHFRLKIDPPNAHRLLELYTHMVPLLGHALFLSRLTLEANHQPLKYSISKDTDSRSHISPVPTLIMKAWFRRIYEVIQLTSVDEDQFSGSRVTEFKTVAVG